MNSDQQQWLGFEIGGAKLALPLNAVASVFHSVMQKASEKSFGLEVYEGVPVFVLSPADLFGLELKALEAEAQSLSWVIVLRTNEDAYIGFRVQKTIGPFHALKNQENQIQYLEQTLNVVNLLERDHV
jgi:chemotaxis signal transduction protein